jgi:hypothetical protein
LRIVGFHILLPPPCPTALFYGFLWYCGARRDGYRKGSREGQNQGEFPHTLFLASSIISAFICGSPPFEVDFVYVVFSHERGGRQACRSRLHFVIVCCGSVKALLLGFQYLECWVSGLRNMRLLCSDFPPVYVLESRRMFSDCGVLFI